MGLMEIADHVIRGIRRLRERLERFCIWPGMRKDVMEKLATCFECQSYRPLSTKEVPITTQKASYPEDQITNHLPFDPQNTKTQDPFTPGDWVLIRFPRVNCSESLHHFHGPYVVKKKVIPPKHSKGDMYIVDSDGTEYVRSMMDLEPYVLKSRCNLI